MFHCLLKKIFFIFVKLKSCPYGIKSRVKCVGPI